MTIHWQGGTPQPIGREAIERSQRGSGPGEPRTCADVFAAMQRPVDAKVPAYRD